jgi:hypothetical protein
MDRSFWSLHDNVTTYFLLGLPTLGALAIVGVALAAIVRSYNLDAGLGYFLWGLATPISCMAIFTLGPLPCSVFAWSQAQGEDCSISECFSRLFTRPGRMLAMATRLLFHFTWWTFFFGIPFLAFWPRTCMAPMVAIFENQRRVFWRSRKLMQEDHAIFMLAGLHLAMTVVLGTLIFLPRLLIASRMLSLPWVVELQDSLWAFELVFAIVLMTGIAISWCVALTLFYHDLRYHREGEALRGKVDLLANKYGRLRGTA